jgi:hypothetical protein
MTIAAKFKLIAVEDTSPRIYACLVLVADTFMSCLFQGAEELC